MSCPKNRKTKLWGLISYEGEHEWKEHEIERASKWRYRITLECRLCEVRDKMLLGEEDMLRRGFDLKKLRMLEPSNSSPFSSTDVVVAADKIEEYRVREAKSEDET